VEEECGYGVNGGQCESALPSNSGQLGEYIGEGSARMVGDRVIKPLSSLHYFLKKVHTVVWMCIRVVCLFFLWQSTLLI
jgi:hypothetical protein